MRTTNQGAEEASLPEPESREAVGAGARGPSSLCGRLRGGVGPHRLCPRPVSEGAGDPSPGQSPSPRGPRRKRPTPGTRGRRLRAPDSQGRGGQVSGRRGRAGRRVGRAAQPAAASDPGLGARGCSRRRPRGPGLRFPEGPEKRPGGPASRRDRAGLGCGGGREAPAEARGGGRAGGPWRPGRADEQLRGGARLLRGPRQRGLRAGTDRAARRGRVFRPAAAGAADAQWAGLLLPGDGGGAARWGVARVRVSRRGARVRGRGPECACARPGAAVRVAACVRAGGRGAGGRGRAGVRERARCRVWVQGSGAGPCPGWRPLCGGRCAPAPGPSGRPRSLAPAGAGRALPAGPLADPGRSDRLFKPRPRLPPGARPLRSRPPLGASSPARPVVVSRPPCGPLCTPRRGPSSGAAGAGAVLEGSQTGPCFRGAGRAVGWKPLTCEEVTCGPRPGDKLWSAGTAGQRP